MTLLVLGRQPDLWRAGVDLSGMSDLRTMEKLEDQAIRVDDETEFGVLGNHHFCDTWWGDVFGVQLAVDLNLKSPFDRIYAGAVIEPIAGVSLGGGFAMVKGQYVPSGYAANMLVPSGATFTPNSKYMPTGYLGLTVTNEVITSLSAAAKAITASASAL